MCRGKKPKKCGRSKLQPAKAFILWFAKGGFLLNTLKTFLDYPEYFQISRKAF